jgi:hypothetical protein
MIRKRNGVRDVEKKKKSVGYSSMLRHALSCLETLLNKRAFSIVAQLLG